MATARRTRLPVDSKSAARPAEDPYVAKIVWFCSDLPSASYSTWAEREDLYAACQTVTAKAMRRVEGLVSNDVDIVPLRGRPAMSLRGPGSQIAAILKSLHSAGLVDRVADEPIATMVT